MIPNHIVIMRYARQNKFCNVKENIKVKTLLRKITYCGVDKSQIVIQLFSVFHWIWQQIFQLCFCDQHILFEKMKKTNCT